MALAERAESGEQGELRKFPPTREYMVGLMRLPFDKLVEQLARYGGILERNRLVATAKELFPRFEDCLTDDARIIETLRRACMEAWSLRHRLIREGEIPGTIWEPDEASRIEIRRMVGIHTPPRITSEK